MRTTPCDEGQLFFPGPGYVTPKAVDCIDARTGAETWRVPVFGAMVDAWPLQEGAALIADGTPLSLSRVSKEWRRQWQVELPDTELVRPAKLDARGTLKRVTPLGAEPWVFSATMAITSAVIPSELGLSVLDLDSGNLAQVKWHEIQATLRRQLVPRTSRWDFTIA